MSAPKVVIVVLNYNGLKDTPACLDSLALLEYANKEVIVVDNNSTDGSVTALSQTHPLVKVIETGENLGYAEGNNVGLRYALAVDADYVLILNNDTEVAPDFLTHLVNAAEADAEIGIVGPTIYYFDQPQVIWSAGGRIDWEHGETSMIGLDEADTGQFGLLPQAVDFVTGCALLIKRGVLERVGLIDARFFMYYEETEWCHRVQRAGYQILHVPQARIWHKIVPARQNLTPHVHYYMTRNRLLFLRAGSAPLKAWIYTLLFDYLRTLLSWSVRPKWRHMRGQRDVMIRAICDYWLARFGRVDLSFK